jgi:hypothetical protein
VAKNQFTKQLIKNAAWHEAGHAVHRLECIDCATRFELGHASFQGVWVKRTPDDPLPKTNVAELNGRGALLGMGNKQIWCSATTQITNYLAGIAGERILKGHKKVGKVTFADWIGGAQNDLQAASKIIKEELPGIDSGKFIDGCLATAWVILGIRRKAVEAIANALIEKGYLSYEECKKIYEENQ